MSTRCKFCGEKVTKIDEGIYKCPNHNSELSRKAVIDGYTLISRKHQLELMHKMMQESNDESIYLVWISTGVPDCPSDDDFLFIAANDDEYNEISEIFIDRLEELYEFENEQES